jgi:RNA polymerase-associated protein LEO1
MSSLAGALEEPVRYNHSYSSALSSVAHDQDVDMETPEVKKEPNAIPGQAGMHRDGGDEPMDDLFGQDAEVDEPRQVKSETCVFMSPHNNCYTHTTRIQKPCCYTCGIRV